MSLQTGRDYLVCLQKRCSAKGEGPFLAAQRSQLYETKSRRSPLAVLSELLHGDFDHNMIPRAGNNNNSMRFAAAARALFYAQHPSASSTSLVSKRAGSKLSLFLLSLGRHGIRNKNHKRQKQRACDKVPRMWEISLLWGEVAYDVYECRNVKRIYELNVLDFGFRFLHLLFLSCCSI